MEGGGICGTRNLLEQVGRWAESQRPKELHDEGEIFQFRLHAIEIAAHFFKA
jgi:hypothetical protein